VAQKKATGLEDSRDQPSSLFVIKKATGRNAPVAVNQTKANDQR